MIRTFRRIVIAAIALIAVAALACALVVAKGCNEQADPLQDARNGAVNAVIDASGIKERLDRELREKAGAIAEEYGISRTVVDHAVDSLDIASWKAVSLPADAVQAATYDVSTESLDARVTTYDDPSIVTIDAYDQTVTMELPASAQPYLTFLRML